MNDAFPSHDPGVQLRRWAYALLITLTAGITAGRILSIQLVTEPGLRSHGGSVRPWPATMPAPMPTYGSNDRSRWCTVRALVDEGTYAIGKRHEYPPLEKNLGNLEVQTVVAARLLDYFGACTQPGLLGPTPPPPPAYSDEGIVTKDGWKTVDVVMRPETKEFYSSKPPLLPTIVAGEYWVLQKLFGWTLDDHPWEVVRTVLLTVNWLPLLIYLYLMSRMIERLGTTTWGRLYAMAAACLGTFLTTFLTTLNNHTMAAFGLVFALYPMCTIYFDGKSDWWRFVLAGFFAAWTVCNELPAATFGVALFALMLVYDPWRTILFFVPAAAVPILAFLGTNYLAIGEFTPAYEKFGSVWYEFPGAWWAQPRGIDAASDSTDVYAFHLLLGHHGIFSLSPIFVLSLGGMLRPFTSRWQREHLFGVLALALSVIVFGFYLVTTNNYGGWTSGPRWFFWLIPLWLLALVPIADGVAPQRGWRVFGYVLLALSAMSASYPAWNPWRHPWLYNLLEYMGVIRY